MFLYVIALFLLRIAGASLSALLVRGSLKYHTFSENKTSKKFLKNKQKTTKPKKTPKSAKVVYAESEINMLIRALNYLCLRTLFLYNNKN